MLKYFSEGEYGIPLFTLNGLRAKMGLIYLRFLIFLIVTRKNFKKFKFFLKLKEDRREEIQEMPNYKFPNFNGLYFIFLFARIIQAFFTV
jgi:hypothetical protein